MRNQGKRAGIPLKASWKEKQKENAQRLKGPQPMRIESRAHRNDAALSIKGKENREGVAPAPEEGEARVVPELKRPRSIFEGFRGGSGRNEDAIATTFLAPVSGTPRDLVHSGAVQRGIPTRGGGVAAGQAPVQAKSTTRSFILHTNSRRVLPSKNTSRR